MERCWYDLGMGEVGGKGWETGCRVVRLLGRGHWELGLVICSLQSPYVALGLLVFVRGWETPL